MNYLSNIIESIKHRLKPTNIRFNKKVFKKYKNIENIINKEYKNLKKYIKLKNIVVNNIPIKKSELRKLIITTMDKKYNTRCFCKNNKAITISNGDIKELVDHITNISKQRKYIIEHITVLYNIKKIINNAVLVNQEEETKNRTRNVLWHYYITGINIKNEEFFLEFDVVSRDDGENHYRIQRIYKKDVIENESK